MTSNNNKLLLHQYDFDDYSRQPITFHYCQVGFHPDDRKLIFVWTRENFQSGKARVWSVDNPDSHQNIPIIDKGGNIWGRQDWEIDLSEQTEQGEYIVEVKFGNETVQTAPVSISANVYDNLIEKAAKHYFLKRCGIFCHTNDAYVYSLDKESFGEIKSHMDVSGGWHDAHDDNKWVVYVWMALYGLLKTEETCHPDWRGTNEPFPYCLSEAWWEIEWLLKMQKADGSFYYAVWEWIAQQEDGKVTFPIHDPEMHDYDDLGKDRRILVDAWGEGMACKLLGAQKGQFPSTAPKYFAYLAHIIRYFGRLIRPYDKSISDRCIKAAKQTVAYLEGLDKYPEYQEIEVCAGLALYHIECARGSDDAESLKKAEELLKQIFALQQPEGHFHASDNCRGLEIYPEEAGDERVFVDYPFAYVLPIIEYLEFSTVSKSLEFGLMTPARKSLKAFSEMLAEFCQGTVFGQLTEISFDREPEVILSKVNHGYNPYLLSAGVVFAAAHRYLGETKWKNLAQQQLHWVLGANPRFMSFMNQVGVRNSGQYAASSSETMHHYSPAFYRHLRDMRWGITVGIYGTRLKPTHYLEEINSTTPQSPNYPNAGMSISGVYDSSAQETWVGVTGWFLMLLTQLKEEIKGNK